MTKKKEKKPPQKQRKQRLVQNMQKRKTGNLESEQLRNL